jgi:hypothetical protein
MELDSRVWAPVDAPELAEHGWWWLLYYALIALIPTFIFALLTIFLLTLLVTWITTGHGNEGLANTLPWIVTLGFLGWVLSALVFPLGAGYRSRKPNDPDKRDGKADVEPAVAKQVRVVRLGRDDLCLADSDHGQRHSATPLPSPRAWGHARLVNACGRPNELVPACRWQAARSPKPRQPETQTGAARVHHRANLAA